MKIITDYIVVRDNDADDFGHKVRQKLKEGYRCRGQMKVGVRGASHLFDFLQNMVKEETT